jgi:hypothetical protein
MSFGHFIHSDNLRHAQEDLKRLYDSNPDYFYLVEGKKVKDAKEHAKVMEKWYNEKLHLSKEAKAQVDELKEKNAALTLENKRQNERIGILEDQISDYAIGIKDALAGRHKLKEELEAREKYASRNFDAYLEVKTKLDKLTEEHNKCEKERLSLIRSGAAYKRYSDDRLKKIEDLEKYKVALESIQAIIPPVTIENHPKKQRGQAAKRQKIQPVES